jgi:hypothetical protein
MAGKIKGYLEIQAVKYESKTFTLTIISQSKINKNWATKYT